MDFVEEIRKFVEEECRKPTSCYGYEPYEFHFLPTVEYAKQLAERLNADIEICVLSAWLHDIGSIIKGRENHHITGAEIAGKKLKELGYNKEKIERVKHCILVHRGSQKANPGTVEAQILIDADSMSNFDNLPGIFKAAFIYENQNQGMAKRTTREKLVNKFNQLNLKESKEIIKPKYDAMLVLLK